MDHNKFNFSSALRPSNSVIQDRLTVHTGSYYILFLFFRWIPLGIVEAEAQGGKYCQWKDLNPSANVKEQGCWRTQISTTGANQSWQKDVRISVKTKLKHDLRLPSLWPRTSHKAPHTVTLMSPNSSLLSWPSEQAVANSDYCSYSA